MCLHCDDRDEVADYRRKSFDNSPEADRAAMEAEIAEDNLRPLFPEEKEAEAIEDDIHGDDRRPNRHHR